MGTNDAPGISWHFDERARDVPDDPAAAAAEVARLRALAATKPAGTRRARLLGEAGAYARMLGWLDLALDLLGTALTDARAAGDARLAAVVELRLAHALHWCERYGEADARFAAVLDRCVRDPALEGLESFARQHLGKSLLDQGRLREAVSQLERALALREAAGAADLVESIRAALALARAPTPPRPGASR